MIIGWGSYYSILDYITDFLQLFAILAYYFSLLLLIFITYDIRSKEKEPTVNNNDNIFSAKEKLLSLKTQYESGDINEEQYNDERQKILNNL